MNRFILSTIVCAFFAVLTGVSLAYCLSDTPVHHHDAMPLVWPIISSAHFFAFILNLVFYFMNRWGHFNFKWQGALVTLGVYIAVLAPGFFLRQLYDLTLLQLITQYALVVLAQFVAIGVMGTYFMKIRTECLET